MSWYRRILSSALIAAQLAMPFSALGEGSLSSRTYIGAPLLGPRGSLPDFSAPAGQKPGVLCAALFATPPKNFVVRAFHFSGEKLKKFANSLPIFYLFGKTKQIDNDLVDQYKSEYRAVISNALESIKADLPSPAIRAPESNEEKLALMEVVAESMDNSYPTDITAKKILDKLREDRRKDLAVLLGRWKSKRAKMSHSELMRIMDYYYLASNREYFALMKNYRAIVMPSDVSAGMRQLARTRWQVEVAKHDILIALQKLNILSHRDSWYKTWGELITISINLVLSYEVNLYALQKIGVIVHWPDFSFYRFPGKRAQNFKIIQDWKDGKISEDEAFIQFLDGNKYVNKLEFYHRWLKRMRPFIVSFAMINAQVGTYNHMESHMENVNVPTQNQTVTRAELESSALSLFERQSRQAGEPWDEAKAASSREIIADSTFEELKDYVRSEGGP